MSYATKVSLSGSLFEHVRKVVRTVWSVRPRRMVCGVRCAAPAAEIFTPYGLGHDTFSTAHVSHSSDIVLNNSNSCLESRE